MMSKATHKQVNLGGRFYYSACCIHLLNKAYCKPTRAVRFARLDSAYIEGTVLLNPV